MEEIEGEGWNEIFMHRFAFRRKKNINFIVFFLKVLHMQIPKDLFFGNFKIKPSRKKRGGILFLTFLSYFNSVKILHSQNSWFKISNGGNLKNKFLEFSIIPTNPNKWRRQKRYFHYLFVIYRKNMKSIRLLI